MHEVAIGALAEMSLGEQLEIQGLLFGERTQIQDAMLELNVELLFPKLFELVTQLGETPVGLAADVRGHAWRE